MKQPNITTTLKDDASGVTYHVMAYRSLTQQEMIQAIRVYLTQTRKKPKRGRVVTVVTIIGHDG